MPEERVADRKEINKMIVLLSIPGVYNFGP